MFPELLRQFGQMLWAFFGLLMILLSFSDSPKRRLLVSSLFFIFAVIIGFRGSAFNADTYNYTLYLQGIHESESFVSAVRGSHFEFGFAALAKLLLILVNRVDWCLAGISIITAIVFVHQFLKYKFHPAIISFFFVSFSLVGSTTIIRQYFAMACTFILANRMVLAEQNASVIGAALPVSFHYASIPISGLAYVSRRPLYLLSGIFLISLWVMASWYSQLTGYERIVDHGVGRAMENVGSLGIRNLLNIPLVAILLVDFNSWTIRLSRVNKWVVYALLFSIILAFSPGLNRILPFFVIFVMCSAQKHKEQIGGNGLNFIQLNLLNIMVLFYFSFFHTII